jgi:NAD-dependent deacetylase
MHQIDIDKDTRVFVLTGAGVSAESGIPTFRDANGLWEQHRVEDVASPAGFRADPALVWRFYSERREAARRCGPNPGHKALAALEAALGDRFLLATQNVDGLHRKAGSERVVELHGNLYTSRCARCERPPFPDDEAYAKGTVPVCGRCKARGEFGVLRPHIVWFGEALDHADLLRVDEFMTRAKDHPFVFLAAGTSGLVHPSASFARFAHDRCGARTWLVNLDTPANVAHFDHVVLGRSGEVLPGLFDVRA